MTSKQSRLALEALLLALSVVVLADSGSNSTGSPPPTMTMADLIKEHTFQHHTGRKTSAIYNITSNSTTTTSMRAGNSSATQQVPGLLDFSPLQAPAVSSEASAPAVVNVTQKSTVAIPPAKSNASTKATPPQKAAPPPQTTYVFTTVDGDPILVTTDDKGQAIYRDTWAIPAAVVLLLVICAGIGIFVVYRRRRAATTYHGLREAELGQVHRNF